MQIRPAEWDSLSDYEQLTYLEGLRTEGIIAGSELLPMDQMSDDETSDSGEKKETGPDLSKLARRTVHLTSVNWEPPK